MTLLPAAASAAVLSLGTFSRWPPKRPVGHMYPSEVSLRYPTNNTMPGTRKTHGLAPRGLRTLRALALAKGVPGAALGYFTMVADLM